MSGCKTFRRWGGGGQVQGNKGGGRAVRGAEDFPGQVPATLLLQELLLSYPMNPSSVLLHSPMACWGRPVTETRLVALPQGLSGPPNN